MSLQPAAGTKQALRGGVGSKVGCHYTLCYLKTGLLLESWPIAAGKVPVGCVGEAGMLCFEEEGARSLQTNSILFASLTALSEAKHRPAPVFLRCSLLLYPALTPEHLLSARRRFAAV